MLFDDLKTEYQNVLVAQLSVTLCDSMDCSPPGSSVQGVLKARILKCFAIPFSSGSPSVRTLHHDLSVLVALHGMAHIFIELDKADPGNEINYFWSPSTLEP